MKLQNLTVAVLKQFVGGQLEAADQQKNYVYRGEVVKVELDGPDKDNLVIKLKWLAKKEDGGWVNDDGLNHNFSLRFSSIAIDGNCLVIWPAPCITTEILVFFPAGHKSNLDPAEVKGL